MLCETPGCRTERVYMGKMAKESGVLLQPGHKWNNMVFYNHTGLKLVLPPLSCDPVPHSVQKII